jgi:hypothetical protein
MRLGSCDRTPTLSSVADPAHTALRALLILGAVAGWAAVGAAQSPERVKTAAEVAAEQGVGVWPRQRQVERHGITWHFAADCIVGAFANGDPWVVGPVVIVAIEPASVEVLGRIVNGSMVDPDPSTMQQGYDTCLFGDEKGERYSAQLNVGFGLSAAHPLELHAPVSLVSVQSRADRKALPLLQTAAVLTVLSVPPAPDAFRPPYVVGSKKVAHRAVDLDFQVLRSEKPVLDVPPIGTVASGFERLWLDHFPEWPVRYAHPADNMPDYGREMAALVGSGGLLLNLDLPNDQKRTLLVRMTQLGIDSFGALAAGCRWPGLGGHGSGRKFPILLAGLVLHDEEMLSIGAKYPSGRTSATVGDQFFSEDGQTFYVRETSEGVYNWGFGGYTKDHDGLPEWGFNHASQPDTDRSGWDDNPYRRCCSANGWVGEALAARMLGLQAAWGHPAFFDYMDRYMQVQHTDAWHRAWTGWHASMWDAYRSNF